MAKKPAPKQNLQNLARQIARQVGVPESLFLALIQQESGWNPRAGSSAGAQGLTQLMPGTARGLGVENILDPRQNLTGGAKYLRSQLSTFKDPRLALSAYNSGPGGSESSGQVESFEETRNYVQNVMALEAQYRGGGGGVSRPPPMPTPAPTPGAPAGPMGPMGGPPAPPGGGGNFLEQPRAGGFSLADLISRVSPGAAREYESLADMQANEAAMAPDEVTGAPTFAEMINQPPPTAALDAGDGAVGGMNAEFQRRLEALMAAVKKRGGSLSIGSGARSPQEQASLWQNALKKYGDEATARKWVAPPGKSHHDPASGARLGFGQGAVAADIRGDLDMAHELAAQFGLVFPLSNEAWHIEPAGIRGK